MDESKFYINARRIAALRPCSEPFRKYKQEFGTGRVLLTKANVRRAMEARLDLSWLASRMSVAIYTKFGFFSKQDKAADAALAPIDDWQYGADPDTVLPNEVDKVFNGFVKLSELVNAPRPSERPVR